MLNKNKSRNHAGSYITAILLFLTIALAQEGTVTYVSQRTDGSQIVDIYYDISGNAETYTITAEVSFDDGVEYVPIYTATGDYGAGITTGSGKQIEWQIGEDYPYNYSTETKIRITATGVIEDIDGNTYETVQLGDQLWMAENLKTTHYNNGDEIPTGFSNSEWSNLDDTETGAYAVYNDDPANAETYGNLYNWYAVDDDREVCPEGWHVPTDAEWTTLTNFLGSDAGSQLAGNADLWNDGYLEWNEEFGTSGYIALPGGQCNFYDGNYYLLGNYGYFWSSTAYGSDFAWSRYLDYYYSGFYRSSYNVRYGFSIRCLGD